MLIPLYKNVKRWLYRHKSEYFFGFGADSQSEMIEAVIGRKPDFICNVTLFDYQLCVQSLEDIPNTGANPRAILAKAWGKRFKSYTIRKHKGEKVTGSLFKVTRYERFLLDTWELVAEGWQDSARVTVISDYGKKIKARTQVLPQGHNHGYSTAGISYRPWLMPKEDFVRIASNDSRRYASSIL